MIKYLNNGIHIINTLIGVMGLYAIYAIAYMQVEHMNSIHKQLEVTPPNLSILDLILHNKFFITIGLSLILAPILSLYKTSVSWVLSFSLWIIIAIILIPLAIYGLNDVTITYLSDNNTPRIFQAGLFIPLFMLIVLSLKSVRALNGISKQLWIKSFGITIGIYIMYCIARILHLL